MSLNKLFSCIVIAASLVAWGQSVKADCGPTPCEPCAKLSEPCNPIFLALFAKGGECNPCGAAESCNLAKPCDTTAAPCDAASCGYCDAVSCDPSCNSEKRSLFCKEFACGPCDLVGCGSNFKLFRGGTRLKLTGWIEAGIIGNSHGADFNDGTFLYAPNTTKFNLNQLFLGLERQMDASKGFDWGGKVDFMFGMQGLGVQSYGDETLDYNWDCSDDYGSGLYQMYFTLGYKNLDVKIGKFVTPIGWEGTTSWDNFFYTHSNVYYIEPTTHTGVLAGYNINDKIRLTAGWVGGMENFCNRYKDNAFLGGVEIQVTKKVMLYYYLLQGTQKEGLRRDGITWRNESMIDGAPLGNCDFYVQSFVCTWSITDKLSYVFEWDLHNRNYDSVRWSGYGINNHLIYQFNEKWGVGLRFEWMRDNGGDESYLTATKADMYEYTLGVNWNPTAHVRIRPEIRYDDVKGAKMFGDGRYNTQFSGGVGLLCGF